MKLNKSLPYLRILLSAPLRERGKTLMALPDFVVNDIIEILYNVVMGNVTVHRTKLTKLRKNQRVVLNILNAKTLKQRRRIINKQKGGFLGALIPIVSAVLGSIL